MKIVALDTSSTACSIALLVDDKISFLHRILPLQQAQSILPMIEELLSLNKIKLNQLDAIAFGCGPGSFTGVRIAASVTQGLAYALQLPVIPISSLAGLAQAAYRDLGWKKLLVGIDARMQEIYWGAYEINKHELAVLVGQEKVCTPLEMPLPDDKEWYGVGNAWEIYADQIAYKPLKIDASRLPMASGILELAKIKYIKEEWVTAKEALPVYLRDSVAKKNKT
jgi:tRNA threonylcarbamoyladenosine biosynthesis protein TsaB